MSPLYAPTLHDLETMVAREYRRLPEAFRKLTGDIAIRVEDFPDEETMAEMGCETPFDLLGLYRGISLDRKSVMDTPAMPDMIFIYRRPILDYWCETGEELAHLLRHVLVHEIGHHFGLSDADMEAIEETVEADKAATL